MPSLDERIEAELENIRRIVAELPPNAGNVSFLERAGIGALLHGFYNGIENVLKQVLVSRGKPPRQGPSWHRDLLNAASAAGIVSEALARDLRRYLAFRHFFGHGYAVDLVSDRMEPLVTDAGKVFARFQRDISRCLKRQRVRPSRRPRPR